MQYRIFEGNMERLEKKLQRISNKCKKYGNNFVYEKIGEEFEEHTDENGSKYTIKFILVDVEGVAIINNWQYIASVEHTAKGNIFKKNPSTDAEIPTKYYNSKCCCEHCNTKRYRKDTFIVQNTITKEFKQVGKSCLNDFTNGLSAEYVADYISYFEELIQGEKVESSGNYSMTYIDKVEAMQYIAETIRHFGYIKIDNDNGETPTKRKSLDFWMCEHGFFNNVIMRKYKRELLEQMEKVDFNYKSDYAKELTKNVLAWIDEQEETNNYIHNLKVACSLDYVTFDKFGILASAFPAYNKELERIAKKEKQETQEKQSVHVGSIGERINIEIANWNVLTSWQTQYGITYVYKIVDINNNVYTWKSNTSLADSTKKIVATIKAHNEYNGILQTEITRCRKVG